jgi:DNA replication protein DnaC
LRQAVGERLTGATLGNYVCTTDKQRDLVQLVKNYRNALDSNFKSGKNILLMGVAGTGKDHLMYCLAEQCFRFGYGVTWTSGVEMYRRVRESFGTTESERELLRDYITPDFLWISDPVNSKDDQKHYQSDFLYEVIDTRYRKMLPTWMTVNVANEAEFRARLGSQIADRVWHSALRFICGWKSHRG